MLGLLDLQSVLEGEPMPHVGTDADWDWQNASASLALMHNVSMTQPIVSSATLSYHGNNFFTRTDYLSVGRPHFGRWKVKVKVMHVKMLKAFFGRFSAIYGTI